jgi:hypothetical protein
MEVYIPFGSINGDRKYTSADLAAMYASVLTDGVHPGIANCLQVMAAGGWGITIKPGVCQIQGRWGKNVADKPMTLDVTNGSMDRIDAIVLRCDYQTRMISEAIKKGTPETTPVAPSLQWDANAYEICLARVFVSKTATGILQSNITDTRQNGAVCGIINSLISVNAVGLFAQFQGAWDDFFSGAQSSVGNWMNSEQAAFNSWFSGLQDMLDDDQASALAGQILSVQSSVTALQAATVARPSSFVTGNLASYNSSTGLLVDAGPLLVYDGVVSFSVAPINQRVVIWNTKAWIEYWIETNCNMTVSGSVPPNCYVWLCGGGGAGKPSFYSSNSIRCAGGGGGGGYTAQASGTLVSSSIVIGAGGTPAANETATGGGGGLSSITINGSMLTAQGGVSYNTIVTTSNLTPIISGGNGGSGGGAAAGVLGSSSTYVLGANGTGQGTTTRPFGDTYNFANPLCGAGGGGMYLTNASAYPYAGGSNGGSGGARVTAAGGGAGGNAGGGSGGLGTTTTATQTGNPATGYGGGGGGAGQGSTAERTGGAGYKGVAIIRIPIRL